MILDLFVIKILIGLEEHKMIISLKLVKIFYNKSIFLISIMEWNLILLLNLYSIYHSHRDIGIVKILINYTILSML
jgi:hypothetical protein